MNTARASEDTLLTKNALVYQSPAYDQSVSYQAICIPVGASTPPKNWSLKQLTDPDYDHWLYETIPDGVQAIFAPTVSSMSGTILPPVRFNRLFTIGRRTDVRRPGFVKNSTALQCCDGTQVERLGAMIMTAGGCPFIVLSGEDAEGKPLCLMAHAGRDSLLDRKVISVGERSRYHFSVIDAMVAYAVQHHGARPQELTLRSFFCLPWDTFVHDPSHPKYGGYNRLLEEYLAAEDLLGVLRNREVDRAQCLDLTELIRLQALRAGVGTVEVGLEPLPRDGKFAYTTHSDPAFAGDMRNLVIGIHR